MPALALYEDYSREDVHDVFSPDTPFSIGAGSWGLSGIINIPGRTDDFIFMVTYGSSQSGHDFDEPITDDGEGYGGVSERRLDDRRMHVGRQQRGGERVSEASVEVSFSFLRI
jgi:hypothetical protein